ncbi:MAG: glycosyltransferase family 4 protein [Ruminococcaceae bacterium]|nr:glycosyltransferase family 4 protein [Oscillospiraceae bacterium]
MSVLATPKVLVVGINPWIDNTGINTLINFFDGWDKNSIAHIYTRAKLPNTHMCDKFFRISEPKVMKSLLKRSIKTGEAVFNSNEEAVEESQENQIYNKKHSSLMSLAREFVWLLGKWKTKELDKFLDEYDADVLFFPVYANVYMNRLQNYIRKRTKKPVVLYVSDDNYSYKSIAKTPVSLFTRFWLRTQEKKLFKNAEKIMVIAPKQKEEYDRLFNTNSVILTKGIDFSVIPYEEKSLNKPIKMVYTGKLIIGRWLSLAKIAEALGEINKDETKVELDIYTTDTLTEEQKIKLNRNGCSVKGALTLDEVQAVQKQADILVFVESLEKEFRYTARLSFSTKITDYLKSGKCIFAVGDKDIAPIDYFNRYDSAVTATSYDEIGEKLKELINNENRIIEYSKKAYECGKEHHNAELMNRTLVDTITQVAK